MGKGEAKSKGALVSATSSNKKNERTLRMFLKKFSRACSITRTTRDHKCKFPWSLAAFASGCVRSKALPCPSLNSEKNTKEPVAKRQTGSVPTISRDFCKSAHLCDKSAARSQRRVIALGSSSTQPLDNVAVENSSNFSSEFVNHGFLLWNQTREKWTADKRETSKGRRVRKSKISWDEQTYEDLLGNNKPFSEPIRLAGMVYFLVDKWEQEGMYDVLTPE